MRVKAVALLALATLASATLSAPVAFAQNVESFFKGKTINLYIGFGAGGYDNYGRIIARFMGRHIPGRPDLVPMNMPGAGSMKLALYLRDVAPKDGTAFGIVDRGLFIIPLVDPNSPKIDFSTMSWIGSVTEDSMVCVALNSSKVKTFEDLQRLEFVAGGISRADISYTAAALLQNMFGAKIKFVSGYPGGNDISLAMERGEVEGRCAWSLSSIMSTRPNWIADKTINVIVQYGLKRNPDIANVPTVMELADTERKKAIVRFLFISLTAGRPFVGPPAIPPDRLKALREAFMRTTADPDFVAEAKKVGLDVSPIDGSAVEDVLRQIYATPPDIVQASTEMMK
ncbi:MULTISPECIES: tripartite tricarboxylate transporter substrate-binding protein [unclassified Beijerinckia]|uniref:Bug family tripartite tricarboxylate transporter substrate binding protein n=1 Tax=unclassified Beijerinckia TaxID=2638183 RepID=UPI00089A131B|nr:MULTISPECIES: tripartite tricarboxylate transporter substrate-binding protein [unclassified Beijerinckia]MDH7798394.1 tripartite-type tricarboxylate transporter receptor subunit TctC [Beijerinckia sp. GAS462]SED19439.1 Tripartite-type tricarboxylate transporter, receptor component TctC [Beijerinckia sp. 28-YEA-48]